MAFKVNKRLEGFSTCFRQWRAEGTHCRFLHGYDVYIDLEILGEMDARNWVFDFGALKRSELKLWRHKQKGKDMLLWAPLQEMAGDDTNYLTDWELYQPDGKPLGPAEWLNWLLDHTTIVAEDDPYLEDFKRLAEAGIMQLRILPQVGCEQFAKYIHDILSGFVYKDSASKARLVSVTVHEHAKNSATYAV